MTSTRDIGVIFSSVFNNVKNFLRVGIVDSSGTQIDSFGGGSQYAFNYSVVGGEKGTVAMGLDGSTLRPMKVGSTGNVQVDVVSGGGGVASSVAINDGTITTQKLAVDASGKIGINALPAVTGTVTANAGTNLNTSALALESGGNLATLAGKDFATETTLSTLNGKVTACNTGAVVISSGNVTVSATNLDIRDLAYATDSVTSYQGSTWNITNITGTISLPTGAATETTLSALNTKVTTCNTGAVVIASGTITTVTTVTGITNVVHVDDNGSSLTVDNNGTFAVQATLSAETTKVIGVVRNADGSGNLLTSTSNALDINIKSGSIANTSFTVTQGTGTNLHTVIDSGTITTVSTVTAVTGITNVVHVDDNSGTLTVDQATASNLNAQVVGATAHDAADADNPEKIGAKAISAPSGLTLVSANDRTNLFADLDGLLMAKLYTSFGDIFSERVSNTDGASTAFSTFGATSGAKNFITTIIVHNSHATTTGYVDIRDGTSGSILATIPAPASGGAVVTFPVPLKQPTTNTALVYDVSAAISMIYITVVGFKSKVA